MDIIYKDLNLLNTFVVLAEERSLSLAAKKLHLSQPALSYQLKRMREEFGDPLFIRTRNGYGLTERAESLIPEIKAILTASANLYSKQKFDLKTHQREFVLATTTYFEAIVIEKLLMLLKEKAPLVSLKTISLNDNIPIRELESGEYDLAVGAYFNDLPKSFYQKNIGKDHQVCVVRKKHPFLAGKKDLKSYLEFEHIKINVPIDSESRVDKLLSSRGLSQRKIIAKFNNFFTPALVLKSTNSILTVPQKLAQVYKQQFGLEVAALPGTKIELDTQFLWHERHHLDPFHKWIRAELEKMY